MPLNSSKKVVLQFFEKFANVDKGETIPVTGNRRCSAWVIYGRKGVRDVVGEAFFRALRAAVKS